MLADFMTICWTWKSVCALVKGIRRFAIINNNQEVVCLFSNVLGVENVVFANIGTEGVISRYVF